MAKIIYYDFEYWYHVTNPDSVYIAFETDVFDSKCDTFIKDYRYVCVKR